MPSPPPRPSRRGWLPPVVALAVAAILAVVLVGGGGSGGDPDPRSTTSTSVPEPVEISSDSPTYATLGELLAASDLVVRARVTSTERGRVFGEPGQDTALESRLVALEVTEVLRGPEPPPEFLVEEEGWLLDGSPLIVDGLVPSAEGDDAIWFLVDPSATEPAPFVTVNAQGRYLVDGDALRGAEGADPLVTRIEALGAEGLEEAVRTAG
ncbi:hypothetical protein HC251_06800 [Iamia sp. SCSIO 61187]|uniref:hypothetical protein n=1 Tax=Iamia sp. SCSIO 61187 TaxID=2722752 RepID=UPI001C62EB06|nr:hypothetical protein [Iamia sp. SCSIO 61187]QYG92177.1 hypothetical protein HC251_06800 [Iamia sp. SCSIO 61187]